MRSAFTVAANYTIIVWLMYSPPPPTSTPRALRHVTLPPHVPHILDIVRRARPNQRQQERHRLLRAGHGLKNWILDHFLQSLQEIAELAQCYVHLLSHQSSTPRFLRLGPAADRHCPPPPSPLTAASWCRQRLPLQLQLQLQLQRTSTSRAQALFARKSAPVEGACACVW